MTDILTGGGTRPGTADNPWCRGEAKEVRHRFLFLALMVAGKNAAIQQGKADEAMGLLNGMAGGGPVDPVEDYIALGDCAAPALSRVMRAAGTGQYRIKSRAWEAVAGLYVANGRSLDDVGRDELAGLPGFGMKTASFYRLYAHGDRCAVLDTHVLAHLRSEFPSRMRALEGDYKAVEALFMDRVVRGGDPADADFAIWATRRRARAA